MRERFVAMRDEEALPVVPFWDNHPGVDEMPHTKDLQRLWNKHFFQELADLIEKNTGSGIEVEPYFLTDDLAKHKQKLLQGSSATSLITLDAMDIQGTLDEVEVYPLGISTHYKRGDKKSISIGRRPGFPSINNQLDRCIKSVGKGPITLVEDHVGSGSTLRAVTELIQSRGIEIEQVVSGLAVAKKSTSHIQAVATFEPQEVHRFLNARDFLFGALEGGLVFDTSEGAVRAPYVLPYVDLEVHAGIPEENARAFSLGIIDINENFFSELAEYLEVESINVANAAKPFRDFVNSEFGLQNAKDMTMVDFCNWTRSLLQ